MSDNDPINPSHYQRNGIELIDSLRAEFTAEEFAGYCKGQVRKYLYRAGHKADKLTDLRKAQWYLNVLVAELTPDSTDGGA